jgi:protein-tyrosine-phosphatase
MSHTILFMCPHNAAKSVIAAAYFQREMKDLDFRVSSAGTDPSDSVSPAVATMLNLEGFDIHFPQPRLVTPQELQDAYLVVSMGCTSEELKVSHVEYWNDIPMASLDLKGASAAIKQHVEQLAARLRADLK